MRRKQKLIIAILSIILIWLLIVIGTFFIGGPDLAAGFSCRKQDYFSFGS